MHICLLRLINTFNMFDRYIKLLQQQLYLNLYSGFPPGGMGLLSTGFASYLFSLVTLPMCMEFVDHTVPRLFSVDVGNCSGEDIYCRFLCKEHIHSIGTN